MSMQHSVRSVSLTPDSSEASRAVPRQDRAASPRRSSRHIADEVDPETEAGTATDEAAARGRRSRREPADSFFSVEKPPPLEAPPGIPEITGWELAAAMWRDHLPEQLLGVDCASCGQAWPCDAWEMADGLLAQCCEAAQRPADHV
ncbi:hypothetical protein L0U85_13435 [Glycomyces sp. L485]|uniref:hypothetical protein n=1 Tax=Glycomyces sp. L485 TaxID=2909235 RepID=UPI001F4AA8E4|nr:hypothetical protein [Glycomyces sp. L485]MCH7231848.1 hypothetical protein [Glycomyces sp. L485]